MTSENAKLVDLLMPVSLPPLVLEGLSSAFRVHRTWLAEDSETLVARIAPDVRAIATGVGILAEGMHYPIDGAFMSRFPRLEIVANLGVGYDNVDAGWAGEHGIVVTNTPDVLTDETADAAMGLLLCAVRQLPQADRYLRAGKWLEKPFPLTTSLHGRTMGILGLGRIGKAIARRAEAFGLTIAYHGRRPQADMPYLYHPTLTGLARACDILMVVAPGGPETHNMVDAEILEALGPDGILVNIARGSLVDEKALLAALREGKILTAALDVFAAEPEVPKELIEMDRLVLLPHVGSASREARDAMSRLVVENLTSWAAGKGPLTPVGETPWPSGGKRAK
jgi:lactate dehydrogenase-like 2-hydroxyacid dehydrogenase